MVFNKDLRALSAAAAVAAALGGCEGTLEREATLGSAGASVSLPPPVFVPSYCVPIEDPDEPVLFRGKLANAKKKPGGPGAPSGGTGMVSPVALGAPALQPGIGPDTARACGVASNKLPGLPPVPPVQRECFFNGTDPTVQATVERVLESVDDQKLVHVRLTFNPNFVDNSYGATAIGWANSKKGTHTYKDLVGSDHAELLFTNKSDDVALHIKLDYISVDPSRPSGYGSLGVLGGEGKVLVGNPSHVVQATSSLDRNLNGCGYGSYTESSPASDASFTPNPATPNWDYRVVYEMWIAAEAFGATGFGGVNIEYVHASPSKIGENTLIVDPGPCPPDEPPPVEPPPVEPPPEEPPPVEPPPVEPPPVEPPPVEPPPVTPPPVTPPPVEPPPSAPPPVTPPPVKPPVCPPGYMPSDPSDPPSDGTPTVI